MRRIATKFGIDLFFWVFALPLAYILRLEGDLTPHLGTILWLTLIMIPIKAGIILYEKFFLQSWHSIGLRDLFTISRGVLVYMILFLGFAAFYRRNAALIPYSVPLIEAMIIVLGLGGTRFITRLGYENKYRYKRSLKKQAKRVLIAGAGDAGTMIAREMMRHPEAKMTPIGFLDDDRSKQKQKFLGLPVFGSTSEVADITKEYYIDVLLIAMPSETGDVVRQIVEKAGDHVECKVIPAIYDLISGKVTMKEIRDVDVEDLLRREPAQLNTKEIAKYLQDKVVLVTGAGGSIGSEIVRQVAPFGPEKLILIDKSEFRMYNIEQELNLQEPPFVWKPLIADIRNKNTLKFIFGLYHPDVVFHAAAHKHVPLMEANPAEAILNNVGGTKNLVELALKNKVEHFVNVSTDKAVNPTSVMGASKRVAEYIVENASNKTLKDQIFTSVRFGNVLGSSGSVVPKFKKQIENRQPITVTHPAMTRYFMTIPEASQLVLQAGGLEESGAVYVLDMGEPVKILDLARDLVRLSGLEPEVDIPIKITGMRPGEKLYEELLTSEENTTVTRYSKIHVANQNSLPQHFDGQLEALLDYANSNNELGIKMMLSELIVNNKLGHNQELPKNQNVESENQHVNRSV